MLDGYPRVPDHAAPNSPSAQRHSPLTIGGPDSPGAAAVEVGPGLPASVWASRPAGHSKSGSSEGGGDADELSGGGGDSRLEGWRYNEREGRRDNDDWRSEKWAKTLGKGILRALEESFDRNSVSVTMRDTDSFNVRGRGAGSRTRMLPVRRIRHALWEMDRDVTQEQARSYVLDCGLRSDDQLTLAEFARCYYYLFVDANRDEADNVGGYHHKVFGGTGFNGTKLSTLPSTMMDEPVTMSEVARR